MAAAVGEAPHADPVGVDLVERLGEGDRVPVVLDLRVGVDVLTARSVARPEVPVVEENRREPGVGELLSDVRLHELLDVAPASGHDDRGERAVAIVGRVQPAANGLAATPELDVAPHLAPLTARGGGSRRRSARRPAGTRPRAAGEYGTGLSAVAMRQASSRSPRPSSVMRAMTSPAQPPVSGPSSTTTIRFVFATEASTVGMSRGRSVLQIDDLRRDPVRGEQVGRLQRLVHPVHRGDDRDVRALAGDPGHADGHEVAIDVAGDPVQALVLEEEHRVVVADRRPQQALRVRRSGRA